MQPVGDKVELFIAHNPLVSICIMRLRNGPTGLAKLPHRIGCEHFIVTLLVLKAGMPAAV